MTQKLSEKSEENLHETRVSFVAPDNSSFECIVTNGIVQKRVEVKSLTALINKFQNAT